MPQKMKLSDPQIDSLRNTQLFGDPYHGCSGRSQLGGRLATVQSLIDRKLITIRDGVWSVTDAGNVQIAARQ